MVDKKNVLYLHAGAEMYGADKILLEIVEGLDRTKYNPIVVLPNNGVLVDALKKIDVEVHVIPYPILRRKYFNPRGIIDYVKSYHKSCNLIIERVIKDRKISLIHVNTSAVLEGIYLKKKLHAKLLWHVHEIITHPQAINLFLAFLMGRYSDEVLCVSGPVENHLLKTKLIKPSKLTVLHNGITPEKSDEKQVEELKSEFNVDNQSINVGMIGRINAWKGQNDFFNAMEVVLKDNPSVNEFIVGDVFKGQEWRKNELKEKIDNSDYSDRIHLVGYRTDTNNFYGLFDVFALPSIEPDPFPTVALEAMSAGDPIVAYNHGGVTEMVKNGTNGYLVNVRDEKAMVNKINKLVSDDSLRKEFGSKSKEIFDNNFQLSVFDEKINDIYEEIINAKN
ncbi:glycosyltransferase family 4 protein [Fructilactobacillus sanfranciscensis]|uniref:glycosyltransferase family 4 protein n=1 Tax=Fructilactobacillus sanfranciscensis TaxID=1625 RepID=UPI0031F87974